MSNILPYLADEQGFYSHFRYDRTGHSLTIEIDVQHGQDSDGSLTSWTSENIDAVRNAIDEGLNVETYITQDACKRIRTVLKHRPEPSAYAEKCKLEKVREVINEFIRLECDYISRTALASGGGPPPGRGQVFTQKILDTLVSQSPKPEMALY